MLHGNVREPIVGEGIERVILAADDDIYCCILQMKPQRATCESWSEIEAFEGNISSESSMEYETRLDILAQHTIDSMDRRLNAR